jgi:hypothetical protein
MARMIVYVMFAFLWGIIYFGCLAGLGIIGNETLVWIGVCILLFVLFGGPFWLFDGDGLVNRIRNRHKLSEQEKEDMKLLRGYSSRIDWYNISYRAWRTEKSEQLREERLSSIFEESGKVIDKFNEIKTSVSVGKGSGYFRKMAEARIRAIEDHEETQSAFNSLE